MNENPPAHPSEEVLREFDSGLLPASTWSSVEGHVAECSVCCKVLETLAADPLTSKIRAMASVSSSTPCDVAAHLDTRPNVPYVPHGPGGSECPPELNSHPRYRVLGFVGAGGMGVVFRAEHRLMERVVALKILNKNLTSQPKAVERFRQEVKAAAQLSHPNIVTAHDADQAGEIHFLVTEFVEGQDLEHWIAQNGPASIGQACDWIRQAAEGLQHAHQRRMVHRDVKPSNLLLTPGGQVKILDFGLARLLSECQTGPALTPPAVIVGTPDYVAPEQARTPTEADGRADVYSLGCTFYCLLTGQPPFRGGTILQKLIAHQEDSPPAIVSIRPEVPASVAAVLKRMLAKEPAQRYQTPGEVAQALASWAGPHPDNAKIVPAAVTSRRRPAGLVLVACLFLVVGAATLAALWLTRKPDDERAAKGNANDLAPAVVAKPVASPTPVPAPPAATPPASTVDPIIEWVRTNNRFRPDHPVVADLIKKMDRNGSGAGFSCYLGHDLVKSGRVTILASVRQSFFVLELPPNELPKLGAGGVFTEDVTPQRGERISPNPQFQLETLVIQDADAFDPARHFTGFLNYKRVRAAEGFLGVRVRYAAGKNWYTRACRVPNKLAEKEGKLAFDLTPLDFDGTRRVGPLLVFVDVCQYPAAGEDVRSPLIVSNPLVRIVNLTAPPGVKTLPAIEFR